MSNVPLMPMATAVWLVENTTLTFKQIANFCNLHEIEVQGTDGEVAKGIVAYNPIMQDNCLEGSTYHQKMKIDHCKLKVMILKYQLKKKLKNMFLYQKAR